MGWTSLITPPSCLIFVLWEAISDVIWSGTVMSVAPSIWEVQVHWYIRSVIRTGYSSSHWTWRLLDAVARLWIVEGLCFHLHPPTGGSRWSLTHWGISDFWEGGWCEGLTEVMGNRCLLVAEIPPQYFCSLWHCQPQYIYFKDCLPGLFYWHCSRLYSVLSFFSIYVG